MRATVTNKTNTHFGFPHTTQCLLLRNHPELPGIAGGKQQGAKKLGITHPKQPQYIQNGESQF
jgi:hypothetical protein